MATPTAGQVKAFKKWAPLIEQMVVDAQTIIDTTSTTQRIMVGNNLLEVILQAGAPDAFVAESTMTQRRAVGVLRMFESFGAWLQSPLRDAEGQSILGADGQPLPPPIVILSEEQ